MYDDATSQLRESTAVSMHVVVRTGTALCEAVRESIRNMCLVQVLFPLLIDSH